MMNRIHRFFSHGCVGFVCASLAIFFGFSGGALVGLWLFEGSRMEIPGIVIGGWGGFFLLTWAFLWLAGER